jgi:hypothetical protein
VWACMLGQWRQAVGHAGTAETVTSCWAAYHLCAARTIKQEPPQIKDHTRQAFRNCPQYKLN